MVQVFIAGLLCLAAGFGSMLRFLGGVDEVLFLGVIVSLARMAPFVYGFYMLTNQIAAHNRPPEAAGTDFIFSILAAAPMTFTAWHVWKSSPVANVQQFLNLPHDVIGLFIATVYSWVDVSVNQADGRRQLTAALGNTVFIGLLVASIMLLLLLLFGLDLTKVREGLERLPKVGVTAPAPSDRLRCTIPRETTTYVPGPGTYELTIVCRSD